MQQRLTTAAFALGVLCALVGAVQLAGWLLFGPATLRELRLRGHTFPGIALSGYGQEEDIQRSYQAGFAAHLTKPASRESVLAAVTTVTAGQAHGE